MPPPVNDSLASPFSAASSPSSLSLDKSSSLALPPTRGPASIATAPVPLISWRHRAFSLKQGQGSVPNALKVRKETGIQEVAVWECVLTNNKAIIEGLQRDEIQGSKMSHVRIMR
jgi:hypothetical protein